MATLTGGLLLPTAARADTPVAVSIAGTANTTINGVNVADWPLPECQPTQATWQWTDIPVVNVEADTIGSAFIGQTGLTATMTGSTPCALSDTGSMSMTLATVACPVTCIASAGSVGCTLAGSYLRFATEVTMLASGSCTVNGRPSMSVSLQGQWAFAGAGQPATCICPQAALPPLPYEFSSTSPTGLAAALAPQA